MDTLQQIDQDFTEALKSKDEHKLSTLRLVKSALEVKSKEKGEVVTQEQAIQVLKQEAKKREEAAKLYEQSGKSDLAQKEKGELELIKRYLPAELPDEEIQKVIDEVLASAKATSGEERQPQFGQIMGQVMGRLKGQVDGGRVAQLVKKSLS